VGRVGSRPLPECQQLLRSPVAGNAKIDDLDFAIPEGLAVPELSSENGPEGALEGHLQRFGDRVAQYRYPERVRRFRSAVLAVAQAIAIDRDERLSFRTLPALCPCEELAPGDIVVGVQHGRAE